MTEEINYSYQGGLYGELIQNRDFKDPGPTTRHWSLRTDPGAAGTMTLDAAKPVNTTALTTSLRLEVAAADADHAVRLVNDGYWGIPVRPETTYRASFYARAEDFPGPLTASIESADGTTVYARAEVSDIGAEWRQYTVALTTGKVAPTKNARFLLTATHPGTVWLNLVSLFPPTYNNRPNGNRVDLMEKLVAMKPSFLRFPGGNYVEGDTFDERFDWKKTIGPVAERPGHRSPWNYHSTDGLGLLEFLEWCEDMHAEPLLAVFAGFTLRGGHVAGEALQPYIDEALEEVEYITGDASTPWGARRAADGHPAPFPLRYVEIGNEDFFDHSGSYDRRFAQFHDAFKARYPQLQLITTAPVSSRVPDLVDDHFYNTWDKMAADVHHYDGFSRSGPKVLVGEWASQDAPAPWVRANNKGPTPTLMSALGDAAWMIGMERNSDVVALQCYAPLFVNMNPGGRQWAINLIGYDALSSFVSPSYHAQVMFSNHRGDVVLPLSFPDAGPKPPEPVPHGAVGVGTWKTQAEFKDAEVTRGEEVLLKDDAGAGWAFGRGDWQNEDGTLRQTNSRIETVATAGQSDWSDYTFHVKARKLGGEEGFLIRFAATGGDDYLHLNLGGWGNHFHAVEKTVGGQRRDLGGRVPGTIETGRWYDIRVEMRGAEIRCFLDGKLVLSVKDATYAPEPLIATASREEVSGDVILKAVNTTAQGQSFRLDFSGVAAVAAKATGQLLTGDLDDINSLAEPDKVTPRDLTVHEAGQGFLHEFPAHSVTVLRFKTQAAPAVSRDDGPAIKARPFALGDVRLLDGPFKENMRRNADYLLSLDPDRMLHNTRQYCGLEPKGERYGGWESRGIAGHSLGHYLTALSQQYAATGDERFHARIEYLVGEMALCQERYGDGYIGALPPLELETLRRFKDGKVFTSGGFNFVGGAWVPWYTEHKVLAGLKDAWTLGGCAQAKAVTLGLADFVDRVTAGLSPAQLQTMLRVEFGGMNETLLEIHALTGDARYLEVSRRFYDGSVMDPLAAGRDELPGKHANMQIPKVIGEARRYEITGDDHGKKIAEFFWDRVANHHSWVIGGNSDREHFFPTAKFADHLGPEAAETCNSYNMLKLTEHVFDWEPKAAYADYYERVLYNHILASQEPRQGMYTYYVSLKPGLFRTYSTPDKSFWCCVGTGMENHTKYGEAIYFHGADDLYVNLFIPSELTWKEKGLVLKQRTAYPYEDHTELTIKSAPAGPLALRVRCPGWTAGPVTFQLDGETLSAAPGPDGYAEIRRVWRAGDRLRVTFPMNLHTEGLPGAPNKVAFLYGPLVLAGDLGPAPDSETFPYSRDQSANDHAAAADVPALVSDDAAALPQALSAVPGEPLTFRTANLGQPADVTLRPFKDLFYERYNVYWDVISSADWTRHKETMADAAERSRRDEARVVDDYAPGEQQSEVDHGMTSELSQSGEAGGRRWRDARPGGFFAFQMKVLRDAPQVLRCTYLGDDAGGRSFDVLVDGQRIATQKLDRNRPGQFFDVEYAIPRASIAGKDRVTIRFQPHPDSFAGGLFRCAVLKADN